MQFGTYMDGWHPETSKAGILPKSRTQIILRGRLARSLKSSVSLICIVIHNTKEERESSRENVSRKVT